MNGAVFWAVTPCSLAIIALTMEAINSFETSVNIYQNTRRSIPEVSHIICTLVHKLCSPFLQDLFHNRIPITLCSCRRSVSGFQSTVCARLLYLSLVLNASPILRDLIVLTHGLTNSQASENSKILRRLFHLARKATYVDSITGLCNVAYHVSCNIS